MGDPDVLGECGAALAAYSGIAEARFSTWL
jgi:hypothetical protein